MNIFLPYENDIRKSVESLDDKRLNKQILETYQLVTNAIKEQVGEEIKGYKNHPIYLHYKNNLPFLLLYGYKCGVEYQYRFKKSHKLTLYFMIAMNTFGVCEETVKYTPFYMEGSKGQPNYIRTTENVSVLYQAKLIKKWETDKKPPKWTNRQKPLFYSRYNLAKKDFADLVRTVPNWVKAMQDLGEAFNDNTIKGE